MEKKILVFAKAMNRTALGIIHAYMRIYPTTTYSQLKEKFPDTMYEEVEGGFFNTIRPLGVFQSKKIVDGLPAQNLQQCHFMKEDEMLTTKDGVQICVTNSWGKNALARLAARALDYGISVEESKEGESFKKGEFRLELVKSEKSDKKERREPEPAKKSKSLLYWICGAAAVIIIAVFCWPEAKQEEPKAVAAVAVDKPREVITFNNIYFDHDKSLIKSGSETDLNKALEMFTKNPDLKVQIVGHTDKTAESEESYNMKLSLERAEAVKDWLVKHDVKPDAISVSGKGFSEPVADNITEEGRAKNRRIEFLIMK